MDKAKYILLLLFIGFNALVGASLLVKALAGYCRQLWPTQKAARAARVSAQARNRGWSNTAWRQQRSARAM